MKFFVCYRNRATYLPSYEIEATSPEGAAQWIVTNHPHRTADSILVCGPCHFLYLSTQLCFRNPLCGTTEPKTSTQDGSKRKRSNGSERAKTRTDSRRNDAVHFASLLGLSGEFTKDDIKRVYRSLADKNHPDKVASLDSEFIALAERRMKDINRAYEYFRKAFGF